MHNIIKSIKIWFSHRLISKMLLVYIIIFAIPMLLLFTSIYENSRQSAIEDAGRQTIYNLKNFSDTNDEMLKSISFIERQMQADSTFTDLAFALRSNVNETSYQNFLIKEEVGRALYKLYLSNPYVYSLELYIPYSNAVFQSKVGQTRNTQWNPSVQNILDISGVGVLPGRWYLNEVDGEQYFTSYSKPYSSNNPNQKLYLKIMVSIEMLLERIIRFYPYDYTSFYIETSEQELIPIFNDSNVSVDPYIFTQEKLPQEGWKSFSKNGENWIVSWYQSEHTQWRYIIAAPLSFYTSSISVFNQYILSFIITLVAIFLVSMFFLFSYIIKPMGMISKKMRQAEKGDLSVRIYTNRSDELGYIAHRFNVLLDSIDNLIYENYISKLNKQEFELKFIQNQINEHFIYNTLDSIHWIATKHGVPQISKIIFNLSRFFRLTLNNGLDKITIGQVAEILTSYITLLNVRMDNMIEFDLQLEPDIIDTKVVKYLFQPIVENAIVHGIGPKHGGRILIKFSSEDTDTILFTVSDDGVGILSTQLENIRSCIATDTTNEKYFALLNINRQLKLYFADQYQFNIESEKNVGTKVSIRFPRSE